VRVLTIDDVYVTRGLEVYAAPAWAFERCPSLGISIRPIDAAWEPLREELGRRRREVADRKKARWEAIMAAAARGDEWAKTLVSMSVAFRRHAVVHQPHHGFPRLDCYRGPGRYPRTCKVCESEFFHVGRVTCCSNRCAAIRRKDTHVQPKRVEHGLRQCGQCGEWFTPARVDARFCSGRCRVANHRASRPA